MSESPITPDFFIVPSQIALNPNLQPLDGYVYAVIYWYKKMRNEKCTASNRHIARLLNSSPSGVANALVRLKREGFIEVVINEETSQREELIPLLFFGVQKMDTPPETDTESDTTLTQMSNPPYSNEYHNYISKQEEDIKEKKINKKKEKDPVQAGGAITVNQLITSFKDINPSYKQLYQKRGQRQAIERLLNEHGLEKVQWFIEGAKYAYGKPFFPTITTPYELEQKLGSLTAALQRDQWNIKKFEVTNV